MAHGQPSAPDAPEAALARLAGQVRERLPGWRVRSATMAAPGRLEEEATALSVGAVVFPLFMARGWFVTRVLPDRLGGRRYDYAAPLGLNHDLPMIAGRMVRRQVVRRGWHRGGFDLLVAAHGSGRGSAAADAAVGFANRLGRLLPEARISTGFIEQEPTVAAAARNLAPRTVCLPFFALPGAHVQHDVPAALSRAGFGGVLLPAIGSDPEIPGLIARSLRRLAAESEAA